MTREAPPLRDMTRELHAAARLLIVLVLLASAAVLVVALARLSYARPPSHPCPTSSQPAGDRAALGCEGVAR